jgi:hypothetical protein
LPVLHLVDEHEAGHQDDAIAKQQDNRKPRRIESCRNEIAGQRIETGVT